MDEIKSKRKIIYEIQGDIEYEYDISVRDTINDELNNGKTVEDLIDIIQTSESMYSNYLHATKLANLCEKLENIEDLNKLENILKKLHDISLSYEKLIKRLAEVPKL